MTSAPHHRTRPRDLRAGDLKPGDLLLVRIVEVKRQHWPDDEPWTVVRAEVGGSERLLSWPSAEFVEVERPA